VNGLQRAFQFKVLAQLFEREVRPFGKQHTDLLAVFRLDLRLAPSVVMPGANQAGLPALLEKLFDHAQRNSEAPGNVVAGSFLSVVGTQDAFPQIQGDRSAIAHVADHGISLIKGYTIF
jgi:hypothetical protein